MHEALEQDIKVKNIGQAYLLYGPGPQIKEDALGFGTLLNCLGTDDGAPCGQCRPCHLGREGIFPDFHQLCPEGVYYKVKQIREMIRDSQFTAQEGKYKIFLLEDADMLQEEGANALLKSLEEPQPGTVFILLAQNHDRILPTIESRCRIIRYHNQEIKVAVETLEQVGAVLDSVKNGGLEYLFQCAEKYGKERALARQFFLDVETLLGESYAAAQSGATFAGYGLSWDKDTLFLLWERAQKAQAYLEHQVNIRLVIESFFLDIKALS